MSGNIIDRARERIERDGWWRGDGPGYGGSQCMWTALSLESATNIELLHAERALVAEVDPDADEDALEAVFDFNDDPSTTLEDVLLVMKKASARLDEEQGA